MEYMEYLVTQLGKEPYLTNDWPSIEFTEGMVIFNLYFHNYTDDGFNWKSIPYDLY